MKELTSRVKRFLEEVANNPRIYGQATKEFARDAEAIIDPKPNPLVGWVVPRGTVFAAGHPRIAGIELNDELRNGCILSTMEMLTCTDGMHPDAETAVRTIIAAAKIRMENIT